MKARRICIRPAVREFTPRGAKGQPVVLTLDELEALRLSDVEQLGQDSAADCMQVSRGTFQRILYKARHKAASALTEGRGILLEGGNYTRSGRCGCTQCARCVYEQKEREKEDE